MNVGTLTSPSTSKTLTQRFIAAYKTIDKQYDGKATTEQVYAEAIEMLKGERLQRASADESVPLDTVKLDNKVEEPPKVDEPATPVNVKIKDLF